MNPHLLVTLIVEGRPQTLTCDRLEFWQDSAFLVDNNKNTLVCHRDKLVSIDMETEVVKPVEPPVKQ